MGTYADQHKGFFCSGAFDWQRDGAVTEVGWVADLVRMAIPVGKMLCPSNPAQLSETYNDLLSLETSTLDTCVDRLGRPPETLPDGSQGSNPCREIITGKLAPGVPDAKPGVSDRRGDAILRLFLSAECRTVTGEVEGLLAAAPGALIGN